MIIGLQPQNSISTSIFARSLVLVCCNNTGLLAQLQGDYAYAQKMRHSLQNLLRTTELWSSSSAMPHHHHHAADEEHTIYVDTTLFLDDTDIEGFKLNLLSLMFPLVTAPAA
jgi:hypothetical protein